MIPNIKGGSSFRGAGKYYLHDKLAQSGRQDIPEHAQSDDRVAFTDTRNCVNDDPHLAIDEMWATAEAQNELKRANGLPLGGRKCTDPVKTISLSWHPSETPTPEQMIEAADGFLAKMGWSEHQAVYVGHNDTEHAHIHIILNRIHPETGRVLGDHRDFRRAQDWALDYEKEHGRIFCEKRLDYDRPPHERSANDNLPHNVIELTRPLEQQFKREEQARDDLDKTERQLLKERQRAERVAWFEDGAALFKATRNAVYHEVRREYAAEWRELYKDSKAAEKEADAWSRSEVSRALYFAREGQWGQARAAFNDKDSVRDASEAQLENRKSELRERQKQEVRDRQKEALDALREERSVQYQELLLRQRYERGVLGLAAEPPTPANQNQVSAPQPKAVEKALEQPVKAPAIQPTPIELGQAALFKDLLPAIDNALSEQNSTALHPPIPPNENAPSVSHQLTDAAAGGIGQVASYLADQLAEAFAPTPPEVREAQAKAIEKAKDAAEQSKPVNRYMRHIGEAEEKSRSEREQQERDRYWDDDRERRRER